MKIGILTFPNSPSYGASLQMFALYRAVKSLGADVEVINYINPYMKNRQHYKTNKRSFVRHCLNAIAEQPNKRMFASFEKQIKLYPRRPFHRKEKLADLAQRYDYLICGSDQVWNPQITGTDLSYLFDFCTDNSKKIAYAPSFGFSQIQEDLKDQYSSLLKKFKSLSIREEAGHAVIKELIGADCKIVLDPSMLLTKETWEQQIRKKSGLPEHYVAMFIFNKNEKVKKFAANLAKEKGIPLINITGHAFTRLRHKECTGPLGPAQWLSVIQNADYVVTDSFHGTAFSIILEKELFVSLASATNSRLITLLNTFGLNDRIITDSNVREISRIDYKTVGDIMEQKRAESLAYLTDALGGGQ